MEKKTDCCFCVGKDWFRYRVGAVIVSEGHALFARGDSCGYYYMVGGGVHIGERSEEAVLREAFEETGENFIIERPLCMIENFFDGDTALEGFDCHVIEMYYLMKPAEKKEYTVISMTSGGDTEKMCWIPVDKIDDYDIRPVIIKDIIKNIPDRFCHYINDDRK